MADAFSSIVDFFSALSDYMSYTIDSLLWMISAIPEFAESIIGVFAYSPVQINAFLFMSLSIMILFAVIKMF